MPLPTVPEGFLRRTLGARCSTQQEIAVVEGELAMLAAQLSATRKPRK